MCFKQIRWPADCFTPAVTKRYTQNCLLHDVSGCALQNGIVAVPCLLFFAFVACCRAPRPVGFLGLSSCETVYNSHKDECLMSL